jgi:hypothetical protein
MVLEDGGHENIYVKIDKSTVTGKTNLKKTVVFR